MQTPFSTFTLMAGWQEGHPACNILLCASATSKASSSVAVGEFGLIWSNLQENKPIRKSQKSSCIMQNCPSVLESQTLGVNLLGPILAVNLLETCPSARWLAMPILTATSVCKRVWAWNKNERKNFLALWDPTFG